MGGDISLLSINAWAEIPVGDKFSSIIAYRRSYKGPIYNALLINTVRAQVHRQRNKLVPVAEGLCRIQKLLLTFMI